MSRYELERCEDGKWVCLVRAENWDVIYEEFEKRRTHPAAGRNRYRITEISEVRQTRAEYWP